MIKFEGVLLLFGDTLSYQCILCGEYLKGR